MISPPPTENGAETALGRGVGFLLSLPEARQVWRLFRPVDSLYRYRVYYESRTAVFLTDATSSISSFFPSAFVSVSSVCVCLRD